MIDQLSIAGSTAMRHFLVSLLMIFPIVTVLNIIADRQIATIRVYMANDIRNRMFEHLQRLSQAFFQRSQLGDIMTRFTSDLDYIERVISDRILNTMLTLVAVLVYMIALVYLNWYLAILTLVILLVLFPLFRWSGPRILASWYKVRQAEATIANDVQENVRAQPIIQSFSLQEARSIAFRDRLTGFASKYIEAYFLSSLVDKTIVLIVMYVVLVIAFGGSVLVNMGLTSAGDVIAFLGLLIIFSKELVVLSHQLEYIFRAAGALWRIETLLQEKPQITDSGEANCLPTPTDIIQFRDVSFSYTEESYHLDRLNITIPIGQYTALVGPSGAGKSTLLSLLLRFYDPTQGEITIDGVNIQSVTQHSLRAQMGIVFQDSFLFDATIRENICLFDSSATDQAIQAVAKAAEIHDFIMSLPEGYETQVGEAGGRLSGGQRQRIAIARALFRNPPILLLDEVTASLDTEAAAAINRTLQVLAANRTIIAVTHDLQQATYADTIIVLDAGQCVEVGTHQALLAKRGLYAQLWRKQLGHNTSADKLQPLSIPIPQPFS